MANIDERLTTIFGAIVDQYTAQPAEHRRRLLHWRSAGGESFIEWEDDRPVVTRDDLDDLQAAGFVDIDYGSSGGYLVKPTREGRQALQALRREQALSERSEPVDLTWSAARPVLHAAVDVWADAGAPASGYLSLEAVARRLKRDESELGLIRTVQQLAAQEWLEVEYGEDDRIVMRPTARGVAATRGWPAGDGEVAAERLLSVLDDLANAPEDSVERGWAARARDTLMEVGTKTLAEVVSRSVGTAM